MTFKGFAREEQVSTWNIDLNIGEVINQDLKEAERISKGMSANNAMQDRWSNMYLDALVNKHDVEKSNRDTNFKFFMENREAIRKAEADNYKIEIADAGKTGPAPISETIIPKLFELAVNVGSTALKQWVQGEVEKKEEAKEEVTKQYNAAAVLYTSLDPEVRTQFEEARKGADKANHEIEIKVAKAVGLDPAKMQAFREHLGSTAGQLAQQDGMVRNVKAEIPNILGELIRSDPKHLATYNGQGTVDDVASLNKAMQDRIEEMTEGGLNPAAKITAWDAVNQAITNPVSKKTANAINAAHLHQQELTNKQEINSGVENGDVHTVVKRQIAVKAEQYIGYGMSPEMAHRTASQEQLPKTLETIESGLNAGDISLPDVQAIIDNTPDQFKNNQLNRGLTEIISRKRTADQQAHEAILGRNDEELATTISSKYTEMEGNIDEQRAFLSSMQEKLKAGGGGPETIAMMQKIGQHLATKLGAPIAGEAPQLNQSQFKLFNDIISYTDTAIRNELLTEGKTVTDVMNTSSAEIATNRFINSLVQEEINNFPPGTAEDVIMQKVMDDLSDPDSARYKKLKDLRTLEKDDLERWRFSKLEIADTPNNRNSKEYVASTRTILHEDKGNPTRYFDFVKKEKTHYGTKAWLQNVGKRLEFDPNGLSVIHMLNNPPPAVVEFMERSGLSASEFVNQMSDTVGINKIPEHIHISPEESSRANSDVLEIFAKFKSNTPIDKPPTYTERLGLPPPPPYGGVDPDSPNTPGDVPGTPGELGMGGQGGPVTSDITVVGGYNLNDSGITPPMQALTKAILGGEGGWDSINPGIVDPRLSKSTAAEAYKIAMSYTSGSSAMGAMQHMPEINGVNVLKERWEAAGLDWENDLFSPENQVKMNTHFIKTIYPGVEQDLADGNIDKVMSKLRGTWPSIPGGSQENAHSADFVNRYQEYLGAVNNAPQTKQVEPTREQWMIKLFRQLFGGSK